MVKSRAAKKAKTVHTELPVSQPADVPLVAAGTNEVLANVASTSGQDTGTPERPLRVYADGKASATQLGT